MSDKSNESNSHFLLGMGIGVVMGLLFAPRPGTNTRRRLRQDLNYYMAKSREVYGDAKETYEDTRDRVEPMVEEVVEKVAPIIAAAKELSEPYKAELVEQLRAYAKEHIEKELKGNKKLFSSKK